jgi:hypothetical protein
MPGDRVIDAAAQAARRAWLGEDACRRMPWDEVEEYTREQWRGVARAVAEVLDQAALPAHEHYSIPDLLDREVPE